MIILDGDAQRTRSQERRDLAGVAKIKVTFAATSSDGGCIGGFLREMAE